MFEININIPNDPAALQKSLFNTLAEGCTHLGELGYIAQVEHHGDNMVLLRVRAGDGYLINRTAPLTPDNVADFGRFVENRHFQHVLDVNFERMTTLGWQVDYNPTSKMVIFKRNGKEELHFLPTYANALELERILDFEETEGLISKHMPLFLDVGWRRGVNEDCYVLLKPDGRGFDCVPLNGVKEAKELIAQAQEERIQLEAKRVAEGLQAEAESTSPFNLETTPASYT